MHRTLLRVLLIVLLIAGASYGQSLADVARQNRVNKDTNAATAKKVYTTDDLSPSPAPTPVGSGYTAEMWTRQILWQKKWVAYLQMQADKLNAQANVGSYGGKPTNSQIAKAQEALAMERSKLEAMQQAAQHAGMPSTVYDPKTPVRFSRANGAQRSLYMLNAQH